MRLLLDTHAAIWAIASPEALSPAAAEAISDERNEVFVSVASLWEIAIKFALKRKQTLPFNAEDGMRYIRKAGYNLLDIKPEHAVATEQLSIEHYDPFDRMLIAQARSEPLVLVSKDHRIAAFVPHSVLW